ncbi:hypothetical protein [Brevibacillus brevis]|uniref:hypothetical protein n=1 Tax=Brevibacillus brevis TaxID=1393 RepID=UPI000D10BC01|nr:hypothetical protein [Brevibacillus brevis]PSJ69259.1 hypothetical protein C7J99_11195 [Brevibacillus brevis]GEC90798.1 hypothetical protein BBR01nite_31290 [Brevibacillus brevis]
MKVITANDFDREYRDIEGIIELDFHGHKYGYYFEDHPFGEERLVRWFTDLLTIALKLQKKDYLAYKIPESSCDWLEFKATNDELRVSLVESFEGGSILELFIAEPSKEFNNSAWSEVLVSKQQVIHEVLSKARKLKCFIEVLNPQILNSKTIKELTSLIDKLSSHVT